MPKAICVITLGCSKNLVDSEQLLGKLVKSDFHLKHNPGTLEGIVVINTCGFILDAKQESIDVILEALDAKQNGYVEKVFVMGCLSQISAHDLTGNLPGIDKIFGVNDQDKIVQELNVFNKSKIDRRLLSTPKHYAYLKVSEGCSRSCSFCSIPFIRGKHTSRPIEELIDETNWLVSQGVKEVILIAQDLSSYGIDIYGEKKLSDLAVQLASIKGVNWLRLHYLYPAGFPNDLFEIMQSFPNICRYLDIPLQHINNRILKSMRRGHTAEQSKEIIRNFRNKIPEGALRTSFIVGYPGETYKEFMELKAFIDETRFDRVGVFSFSAEEGTEAFNLKGNISPKTKTKRMHDLMLLQQEISLQINESKVGKTYSVLIDRQEGEYLIGRTEFDSPEVDNEVLIRSKNINPLIIGSFQKVKITSADYFDLFGEITK